MPQRFDNPLPSDVALLFVDLQPEIVTNSHTNPAKTIRSATQTSVNIARLLGIPVFVSVVPTGSKAPKAIDEPNGLPALPRRFAGAFDQPELRDALAGTGRKVLAIGGVSSEVAVLHSSRTAIREGYTVYLLLDCCGGLTARTEDAAFQLLRDSGAILSSVSSFFTMLQNDLATAEGSQMMGILMGLMRKE